VNPRRPEEFTVPPGEAVPPAGDVQRIHDTIRTRGSWAAEAALRVIGAPWAAALADRLATSAHLLAAAAEWDARDPSGAGRGQRAPMDRAAGGRDAVGGVLASLLEGVAGPGTYRITRPQAARLSIRWPLPVRTDPALCRVLAGGDGTSRCAIAPDGDWVAAIGGGVRMWNAATGRPRLDLGSHADGVAIAPDGTWLLAAGRADGPVRVWDTRTGQVRATLDGPRRVSGWAIAPDGSWAAAACYDAEVTVWDTRTWSRTAVLADAGSSVSAVPRRDGSWLAAARPARVTIWDPMCGDRTAVLEHDGGDAVFAEVSAPDGSWLVTCCRDGTLRLWDPGAGTLRAVLAPDIAMPRCWAVDPSGSWLGTAGGDGAFAVWDSTGVPRAALNGGAGRISTCAVAPDGSWLATGGDDATVTVWDTATWRPLAALSGHPGRVTHCAVAPDGSWLATAASTGPIRLWDTASWRARGGLTGVDGVTDLATDGSSLIAVDFHGGAVRIWDVRRASREAAEPAARTVSTAGTERAGGAVSPTGSWLATARNRVQRLHDVNTGELRWSADLTGPVTRWAVALDGSWLATAGGHDTTVRIQDAATGRTRVTLAGHGGAVHDCTPAPDGTWLATAGDDRIVRIWNPETGALHATLAGHTAAVRTCVVAPDGSWLASAGDDRTVRVWETGTWRPRHVLTGHAGPVHTCVVAPDSSWLGAVDFGDVWFWDVSTGELMLTGEGRHISNMCCLVGPCGDWLFRIGLHGNQYGPSGDVCELTPYTDGARWMSASEGLELVAGATAGAAAPDGRWLAITARRYPVTIWDTTTWTCAAATWVDGNIRDCGWLPGSDGLWLAGDFGVTVFDFEPPPGTPSG
jgi:WD40 repeat protein